MQFTAFYKDTILCSIEFSLLVWPFKLSFSVSRVATWKTVIAPCCSTLQWVEIHNTDSQQQLFWTKSKATGMTRYCHILWICSSLLIFNMPDIISLQLIITIHDIAQRKMMENIGLRYFLTYWFPWKFAFANTERVAFNQITGGTNQVDSQCRS